MKDNMKNEQRVFPSPPPNAFPITKELETIVARGGAPAEKRQAIHRLKCDAIISAIDGLEDNRFTSSGIEWHIIEASTAECEGQTMVRVVATAREAGGGKWLLTADDHRNPMHCINPPLMVPTGTTDAEGVPVYREDPLEAAKSWVVGALRHA